jgi:hypothetical protein
MRDLPHETSPNPPVRHEDRKIQKLIERIKKQAPKTKVQCPDPNAAFPTHG